MSTEILVISEFVSTALALVLVYFFSKAYKATGFAYLLGLPIGFSFLALSYILLGASLPYEGGGTIQEVLIWSRLIARSYGFAFIAFTYFFSSKTERATKRFLGIISFFSATLLLFVFGFMVITPPLELPSTAAVDEGFTIANLVFLGYAIYSVVRRLELSKEPIAGLWAPTAFFLLVLNQYSSLIWEIDGSQTSFVLAHCFRIASLLLFIRVYESAGRAKH
jgi:hypothetical protein